MGARGCGTGGHTRRSKEVFGEEQDGAAGIQKE